MVSIVVVVRIVVLVGLVEARAVVVVNLAVELPVFLKCLCLSPSSRALSVEASAAVAGARVTTLLIAFVLLVGQAIFWFLQHHSCWASDQSAATPSKQLNHGSVGNAGVANIAGL